METSVYNEEKLRTLYLKVVEEPRRAAATRNLIICPECGAKILMIPTLRVMNEAIENHIQIHKEQLKDDPIRAHQKAISIRIALMGQVLQKSCKPKVS